MARVGGHTAIMRLPCVRRRDPSVQLTPLAHSHRRSGPRRARLLALPLLALLLAGCPRTVEDRFRNLPRMRDGATYIVVFDLGQADAMLVVNHGRSMLIDAGATWTKPGRQNFREIPRVLEALTGRRRLDYFLLTHYHQDHIGLHGVGPRASVGNLGLWGLVLDEEVYIETMVDRGSMVIGPKINTQKNYERALKQWLAEGRVGRRLRVKPHDLIDMGPGLKVEVISVNGYPRLMQIRRKNPFLFKNFPPSENDYSIVLKLTKGDFEMVTGGDLSGRDVTRAFGPKVRTSYNDIESAIAGDIGDIEVYRVHHHGSKNSSNDCFIKVLHPEVSIFSTGENSYHHPDLRVLNALKKSGRIYITSGADKKVYSQVKPYIVGGDINIVVAPDGRHYWVNRKKYRAFSEKIEASRPDYLPSCKPSDRLRSPDTPDEEGPVHGD